MPETASAQTVGRVTVGCGLASRVRVGSLTVDLAVVGAAALVLGILRLGAQSLWIDESLTWDEIRHSYWSYVDGYYWLYYSIERPWTLLAGTSEWALRFPSVVGSVLACTLLVVLGRKVFDRRVGLVSGLLLATSPFVVKWSQQARGYTFLLALAILATLLLLRALELADRGGWALYGVAISALVVWHPVGGLLMVVPHALLAYRSRARLLPHGLLAAVVVMALGVPWAAQIAMRSTGEGVAMNWLTFPSPEVAGRTLLDVSGIAGLGVLLAGAGLWVLRRQGRADAALWIGTWALSPFAVALFVSIERPIYLDRYLIVAAPAFALLAASALVGIRGWPRALALAAVVVGTSVGLARWYGVADGGNWHSEDWRQAVATVLERDAAADPVVVADWSAAPAARYYGATVTDVSEAPTLWVLRWSEKGRPLTALERSSLGFGGHRLVESIPFGRRLSLQLWKAR